MTINFLSNIYEGMLKGFGQEWLVVVLLGIAMYTILLTVVRLDVVMALVALAIPFTIMAIYAAVSVSWGLGIMAMLMGLILAIAIYFIFMRS